jgi:hypothetical protein
VVLFYLWLVLAYGVAVNTFSDVGENNRFRFETDPVALVLALAVLAGLWQWARSRRSAGTTEREPAPEQFVTVRG